MMNETVKKDIISTLTRAISVLDSKKEEGFMEIKELSNTTIHNSSIFQDEDSISVAVIIYAVSKVVERTGEVDKKLKQHIIEMRKFLVEGHLQNFHRAIRNTILHISKLDGKIKMYIEQVMQQGRIKKGSKLYEHGISIARSADLLGISQWQLLDYVGKTTMTDATPQSLDVKKRLSFARELFRGKK